MLFHQAHQLVELMLDLRNSLELHVLLFFERLQATREIGQLSAVGSFAPRSFTILLGARVITMACWEQQPVSSSLTG